MKKEEKKHISVYLKAGKRAATSYYRFYQFFDKIDEDFQYHLMIPDIRWSLFMPISKQHKVKQVIIFIYIYFRVLKGLLQDYINRPSTIIISRCLINRVFPCSYKILLKCIRERGTKIIWDFDDNVIVMREITREGFNWLSNNVDKIVVGSPFLKEYVSKYNHCKVVYMPTTDGDIHSKFTHDIQNQRINEINTLVRIVWVGTFTGIQHVLRITAAFEKLGESLKQQDKELFVTIVCDYPLEYEAHSFTLCNIKWEREIAIQEILKSHIGIMPLEDNENTRGKCGFKLIQYLSAALPVVGSAVGMNKLIINDSCGFALESLDINQWYDAMMSIIKDTNSWQGYSLGAEKEWIRKYSYDSNLKKWRDIIPLNNRENVRNIRNN